MKTSVLISSLFFILQSFSQNDYAFQSFADAYKSKTTIEYAPNLQFSDEYVNYGGRFDYCLVGTFESKITYKGDISFFPSLLTLWYNKKENIPYNSAYFDFHVGRVFNHKRPITIGPVETRIGMGANVGLKFFDNNYGKDFGANAFFAYGFSINTIIDFGDSFQLFYLNTLNFSYNPRYEEMFRTMHEFYFMYDNDWKIKPSIAPYIETFRYKEDRTEINDEITKRFVGIKFGITAVID
jgi:hypothetical protein